jgi:Restriction endonuclease
MEVIMSVSLKQARAISNMSQLVYDFLPGSGHPDWKGHVSFSSIAKQLGLGHYWQEGSKEPAIRRLFELTLEREPNLFEKLILEIVKAAIPYCAKQKRPLRAKDIRILNGHILDLGFKFPTLWEKDFLESLDGDSAQRAHKIVEAELRSEDARISELSMRDRKRDELRDIFYELGASDNRQRAGLKLEKLLNELFEMSQLSPRGSFKVTGEQIDGSFGLDAETYLVEAKWERERLSEDSLLIFRGKIEGKSSFTRGAFISINGYTEECLRAIKIGKQPNFFLIDGYDLTMVLEGQIELTVLLRAKVCRLAEEGKLLFRVAKQP